MGSALWSVLNTEIEYENPYFTAGYDEVQCPDGEKRQFYWISPPDGAEVVAVEKSSVILIEKYRPRLRETVFECPGGGVDAGETAVEAGQRELREETGYVADNLTVLTSYYPSPWMRMKRNVIFATGLSKATENFDVHEFHTIHRLPVDEALQIAREQPLSGLLLEPLLTAEHYDVI